MRRLLLVCSLFLSATCFSQTVVVPTDAVVNGVRIRASASTSSPEVGLLRPGEQAQYLGEVPRWYHIHHSVHGEGFVSKGWTRLVTSGAATPAPAFDVYVVDVGTGLGIFVRGTDFALIYDAGSNDDPSRRFLDFLNKVAPNLKTIDNVVISHAHFNHISMLSDVFDSKEVRAAWDSGVFYSSCEYQKLLKKIKEEGARYHTATQDGGTHPVETKCSNTSSSITMSYAERLTTETIKLGAGAAMNFLHVDATPRSNLNENSLVVMLELGGVRILLPGDSGGGVAPTRARRLNPPLWKARCWHAAKMSYRQMFWCWGTMAAKHRPGSSLLRLCRRETTSCRRDPRNTAALSFRTK